MQHLLLIPVACIGVLIGFKIGEWFSSDPALVRRIKESFPHPKEQEQTSLKLMHDVVYRRIGFTPAKVIVYDSFSLQNRSFRVETFIGPKGRAACLHFLIEDGVVVPVLLVEFDTPSREEDWRLPDWRYLLTYLSYGRLPEFYDGTAVFQRRDGGRIPLDEFSCANMENLDRLDESALLRACHERWQAARHREAEQAAS